jgi:hypothetical protein
LDDVEVLGVPLHRHAIDRLATDGSRKLANHRVAKGNGRETVRPLILEMLEDNAAAARIIQTGKNPTMKHISRTHRVALAWLHERHREGQLSVVKVSTERMAADVFAKAFTNLDK